MKLNVETPPYEDVVKSWAAKKFGVDVEYVDSVTFEMDNDGYCDTCQGEDYPVAVMRMKHGAPKPSKSYWQGGPEATWDGVQVYRLNMGYDLGAIVRDLVAESMRCNAMPVQVTKEQAEHLTATGSLSIPVPYALRPGMVVAVKWLEELRPGSGVHEVHTVGFAAIDQHGTFVLTE